MAIKLSNEILLILSTILVGCFGGYPVNEPWFPARLPFQASSEKPPTWAEKCVADCLARTEYFLSRGNPDYKNDMPTYAELRTWCEGTACLVESDETTDKRESLSKIGMNERLSMSSTTSNCEVKCIRVGNDFPELRRRRKTTLCRRLCQD